MNTYKTFSTQLLQPYTVFSFCEGAYVLSTHPSALISPMVWFSMLISLHTTHFSSCLHPTAQRQSVETGGRWENMTQTGIK